MKSKMFLLVTLTVITSTVFCSDSQIDEKWNMFVAEFNKTARAKATQLTEKGKEVFASVTSRASQFIAQQQAQLSSAMTEKREAVSEVFDTAAAQVAQIVNAPVQSVTEKNTGIVSRITSGCKEFVASIEANPLKTFAIVSSAVIVAAGVHSAIKMIQEDSKNMTENETVADVN